MSSTVFHSEGSTILMKIFVSVPRTDEAAILPYKKYWQFDLWLFFILFLNFFFKSFWRTHVLFWGHWYPCFGFLVTSPLVFKARVGSALFAISAEANVMYIPQDSPLVLHLPTSWRPARSRSLPHMHVQRWDLAQFQMSNRTNRRRTRYRCASDPTFFHSYAVCKKVLNSPIVSLLF